MSSNLGRIPESVIQDILSRMDVVELVGRTVKLKKTGSNYSGLCPFHNEKTPSFTVSQTKQFYHCFGCGAHGDAIAFVMEQQGLSFVEALESLAGETGVELARDKSAMAHTQELKPLYDALNEAMLFYRKAWNQPQAKLAIEYLKERGLDKEAVNRFGLGFALPGWENLGNHLKAKGISAQQLLDCGLVNEGKKQGVYDRFRNRIVYPIRDLKGRVQGFGSRGISPEDTPKYLNSPESKVFHKSECLYGLYEAKAHRGERVVLVEGYMDVIALAQHQIPALATMGTAVNENHLKHVFRYFNKIVFCFDGDKAGRAAAWKAALESLMVKNDDRQIDFAFLPEGEDPDTYIRTHGRARFLDYLGEALPFSEYFFKHLSEEIPPTTLDNKAKLVKKAQPLLNKLPASVFKNMMMNQLEKLKGNPPKVNRQDYSQRVIRKSGKLKQPLTQAQWLGVTLVQYPEWLAIIHDPSRYFDLDLEGIPFFRSVVEQLSTHPEWSPKQRHEGLTAQNPDYRFPLSARPWELLTEEALEEEFVGAIARLDREIERNLREILMEKAKNGELSDQEREQLKKFYSDGN